MLILNAVFNSQCSVVICCQQQFGIHSNLFKPPAGHINFLSKLLILGRRQIINAAAAAGKISTQIEAPADLTGVLKLLLAKHIKSYESQSEKLKTKNDMMEIEILLLCERMQSCRPSLTRRASFFSPFLTHG